MNKSTGLEGLTVEAVIQHAKQMIDRSIREECDRAEKRGQELLDLSVQLSDLWREHAKLAAAQRYGLIPVSHTEKLVAETTERILVLLSGEDPEPDADKDANGSQERVESFPLLQAKISALWLLGGTAEKPSMCSKLSSLLGGKVSVRHLNSGAMPTELGRNTVLVSFIGMQSHTHVDAIRSTAKKNECVLVETKVQGDGQIIDSIRVLENKLGGRKESGRLRAWIAHLPTWFT